MKLAILIALAIVYLFMGEGDSPTGDMVETEMIFMADTQQWEFIELEE